MQMLSDALDLYHRMPHLWWAMDDLHVAPWRARKIAAAAHGLSPTAAAFVEAQVLPIADSCGPTKLDNPEVLRAKEEKVPLKRYCDPREIAYAVAFLASPEADFITGQVISPNGGEIIVGI